MLLSFILLTGEKVMHVSKIRKLSLFTFLLLFMPFNIFSEEESITIEEITVTAQKREEDAQSVPIAITALSQELQESTIRNLVDINGYAPNVRIGTAAARARGSAITIRGISYSETDKSFDSPIAVTLDGIFIGTNSGQLIENFDVDRIL